MKAVLTGGLSIRLELEGNRAGWGEAFRGTLALFGTVSRAEVGKAEVWLISVKRSEHFDAYVPHRLARVQWSGFSVQSGEFLRFPFCLDVPWNTEFDQDTQVQARITRPHHGETVLSAGVRVLPPAAYQNIAELFEETAGLQVTGWHTSKNGREVGASLRSIAISPGLFHGVRIGYSRRSSHIDLTVAAELTPRGISDRLLGHWTGRHRSTQLEVPLSDAEIRTQALHQHVARALNRLQHLDLPVPATGPAGAAGQLPRPASISPGDATLADES